MTFLLACATIFSLAYMALRKNGLNVNTLPVQSVGVGIGVDYAIYITDRIRQEYSWCGDLDEGIRRAIRTTGMAVSFTASLQTSAFPGPSARAPASWRRKPHLELTRASRPRSCDTFCRTP